MANSRNPILHHRDLYALLNGIEQADNLLFEVSDFRFGGCCGK
jgi:hypothetical protein